MRKRTLAGAAITTFAAVVAAALVSAGYTSATPAASATVAGADGAAGVNSRGSVVEACAVIFHSTANVTGPESFTPAQQAASSATRADAAWAPFAVDVDAYVAAYFAFRDSHWSAGDIAFAVAQDRLAADCNAVGVSTDGE
jgi:hypothetical protein